jgi:hypothetical protein
VNADEEVIIREFIAAVHSLRLHSDEVHLKNNRRGFWRRVIGWSLVSMVLLAMWFLGIVGLDWLNEHRALYH